MTPIDTLLSKLDYSRTDGNFYWNQTTAPANVRGMLAGRITTFGYRQIASRVMTIHAHVLAFYLHHGRMPSGDVDHINRNRLDNRIENLREATRSQNAFNSLAKRTNKLGARGIVYDPCSDNYRAAVVKEGKRYYCGRHKTLDAAIAARHAKAVELFGEYAPDMGT